MKTSEALEACKEYLYCPNKPDGEQYICYALSWVVLDFKRDATVRRATTEACNMITRELELDGNSRAYLVDLYMDQQFPGERDKPWYRSVVSRSLPYIEWRDKWVDNLIKKAKENEQ
jgi:hypothetical protein